MKKNTLSFIFFTDIQRFFSFFATRWASPGHIPQETHPVRGDPAGAPQPKNGAPWGMVRHRGEGGTQTWPTE